MAVVRYYGAKPDRPDRRDHKKQYDREEIPSSHHHPNVDLRRYVNRVYNQGSLGSCTANAVCAAYGFDLTKQEGYYYFDPSRLFVYYNTREYEGTTRQDSGASVRDTVKALNRKGVCNETLWPYDVNTFREKPPGHCYSAAVGNNVCEYKRLTQDRDQLRACLKDNCPFVFGFKVYSSFHRIGRNGEMPMPSRVEQVCGRHAVMAVGYDDRKRRVLILNSWGSGWGEGGYFYMPYDFITDSNKCHDFWKISLACERGKPRPKKTTIAPNTWGSDGGYSHGASGYGSGGACGYGGGATGGYYSQQRRW